MILQGLRRLAVVPGQFAADEPIRGCRLNCATRLANDDGSPTLFANVGVDTGVFEEIEQVLEGVVIEVVPLEIKPRPAHDAFDREVRCDTFGTGRRRSLAAEIRAADAKDDDPIDFRLEPFGRFENAADVAPVAFARYCSMSFPGRSMNALSSGSILGGGLVIWRLGPDLLANLHNLLLDRLDTLRPQVVLRLQFGERRPGVGVRQEWPL